jgi:hypothetical protein
MALIQKGNSKLKEAGMLMFNLPATKQVCGKICKGCYAIKEQTRFPGVLIAREGRFTEAVKSDFVEKMQAELDKKRKRPKYFRIHASGEFFSQEYVNDWQAIAEQNPDIIFYAYTKRCSEYDFTQISALENFILIDSLQYRQMNYGTIDQAPAGVFICPEQKGADVTCGVDCTYCMTKKAQASAPFFIQH